MLVGVKGKSGRKRKYHNNPLADKMRKASLEWYYKHHEERLAYNRRYHKRIKDYADEHNISFDEARKILAEQKRKERTK